MHFIFDTWFSTNCCLEAKGHREGSLYELLIYWILSATLHLSGTHSVSSFYFVEGSDCIGIGSMLLPNLCIHPLRP